MKKIICIAVALLIVCIPLRVSALQTSAKSAILINGADGEVIFEQNADIALPMASTTKIMTALLLCENGDFDREITVTAEMLRVEGSSMGLLAGDRVTLRGLLYGMLLSSGNDAANVTAYALGNTVNGFVAMMNRRAAELGLDNTSFSTPSGLDGEGHYTTARELAFLALTAMRNSDFAEAVSAKSVTLEYGNPPYKRTITNHNKLLNSFDGAVGVKTGFTKKAGRCLVSAAERDGKLVIAVTLNDPDDWNDHTAMLEYGLSALHTEQIIPERSVYYVPVIGSDTESVKVEVSPYTVGLLGASRLCCEIRLPSFAYAPIKKGDIIGSAVYKCEDTAVAEKTLYAAEDASLKPLKRKAVRLILENIKYIFENIWEK